MTHDEVLHLNLGDPIIYTSLGGVPIRGYVTSTVDGNVRADFSADGGNGHAILRKDSPQLKRLICGPRVNPYDLDLIS